MTAPLDDLDDLAAAALRRHLDRLARRGRALRSAVLLTPEPTRADPVGWGPGWPESWPREGLTLADALGILRDSSPDLAEGQASALRWALGLITASLRPAALALVDLDALGWAGGSLCDLELLARVGELLGDAGELTPWRAVGPLPDGVDMLALAGRLSAKPDGAELAAGVREALLSPPQRGLTLTPAGLRIRALAQLLAAESAERRRVGALTPRPPRSLLVSTSKATRRTLAALVGGEPSAYQADTATTTPEGPLFTLRWPDTDGLQLALPLPGQRTGSPLTVIARRLGPGAVRDILAVMLLCWAQRAGPRDPVWWWPAEHFAVCGLSSRDAQEGVLRRLSQLDAATLSARYPGDPDPWEGAVLRILARHGDAVEVRLHPALWHGVARRGRRGDRFWPLPVALLRHPLGGVDDLLPALAVELAYSWWASRPMGEAPLRRRVESLALALGLASRARRARGVLAFTRKAPARLRAALSSAEALGILAPGWRVEGGTLARVTGHLIATPGPAWTANPVQELHRPAWLPSTGGELCDWLDNTRLTGGELAALLGVSESAVKMWRHRYGPASDAAPERPIPASVRATLRGYLWGPAWT